MGEAFVHMPPARALKRLTKEQKQLEKELEKRSGVVTECESEMKALKVLLYAKFGKAINLDE